MDNLPELRDIHLPENGVSIFPLAYGWWLVLVFVVALIVGIRYWSWFRKNSARIYARYLLRKYNDDSLVTVIGISEILRRICVSKYPDAVALFGNKWIEFLRSKTKFKLSEKSAILLENAPFMPDDGSENIAKEVQELRKFCLVWIGDNL